MVLGGGGEEGASNLRWHGGYDERSEPQLVTADTTSQELTDPSSEGKSLLELRA